MQSDLSSSDKCSVLKMMCIKNNGEQFVGVIIISVKFHANLCSSFLMETNEKEYMQ